MIELVSLLLLHMLFLETSEILEALFIHTHTHTHTYIYVYIYTHVYIYMAPLINNNYRGAWVAQSVKRPTSAQVMISQFVSSSPALGSGLTAQSPEPALDSVSPPLSAPPLLAHCFSLSQQ